LSLRTWKPWGRGENDGRLSIFDGQAPGQRDSKQSVSGISLQRRVS
jgi:hypothetical protein